MENKDINMINNKIKYIYVYEHVDIINPSHYLKKIEIISDKKNDWSFNILLKDMENNIDLKNNDNYLNFKSNIKYNLKKMDYNYKLGKIKILESLNTKCLDIFYEFLNIEKNKIIDRNDGKYYIILKNKIYKNIKTIYKMINKIKEVNNYRQKDILDNIIKELILEYNVIINNLKLYYSNNKEFIPYEDLLFINLKSINDTKYILEYIEESKKCYNNIKLPIKIIEIKKENQYLCKNIFVYLILYNTFLDTYKIIYKIYTIDYKTNIKNIVKNNKHKFKNVQKVIKRIQYENSKFNNNILIINKEYIYLFYIFNKRFILNKIIRYIPFPFILDYG